MPVIRWSLASSAIALLLIVSCAPTDADPEGKSHSNTNDSLSAEEKLKLVQPAKSGTGDEIEEGPVPSGLQKRIQMAINNIRKRELTISNGFWTIFHGILGLGPGVELVDPKTRERVPALNYICDGGGLKGLVFKPSLLGVDVVSTMDGLGQGHQDQFIAEMAQWGMPANRRFVIQGKEFSFMDFVNFSQARVRVTQNQELSWSIIIIAQYKGLNSSWTNPFHEKLHFDDIVRYELKQNIENAACGGTHRLFGLSWVYHMHLQQGGKAEGVWKGVPEITTRFTNLAKKFQNSDGSFSTSYFRERGNEPDLNKKISSTGHMVEWLSLALSDEELREPWMQDAVNALCMQILEMRGAPIEGGSMYHAVHGLIIYYARMFDRSFCPKELLVPLPPGWKKV
ncbi:MAG: hypothetical protein ACKO23_03585 [Gemmataceae bacterium]